MLCIVCLFLSKYSTKPAPSELEVADWKTNDIGATMKKYLASCLNLEHQNDLDLVLLCRMPVKDRDYIMDRLYTGVLAEIFQHRG